MVLEILDLGASSSYFNTHKRTISQVAATSLAPPQMCQLLSRLIAHSHSKQIMELGTSMGITTLYLAKQIDTHVSTFEGNPALINIAQTNFENGENAHLLH